jgi:hypothetical protein
MPTTEQQQPTLAEQRQAAEVSLNDAKAVTAAARAVVEELQSKITAEQNFHSKLYQKFDGACCAQEESDALALQAQIATSDIKLRGLALRLESAQQDVQTSEQAERPLAETLSQVLHAEAVAAEERELAKMVAGADDAYNSLIKVSERLEQSLLALKSKAWILAEHRATANDCHFRILSRTRGFNYGSKA